MEIYVMILLVVFVLLLLLYLSGFFSSFETALTNLNMIDIVNFDDNRKEVKYIKKLKENLGVNVVSILIVNNILNVLISIVPVVFLGGVFNEYLLGIIVSFITLILILFGDIIPKSKAIYNKKKILLRNAKVVYYTCLLFRPLANILIYFSKLVNRISGNFSSNTMFVNDKVIREITLVGHKLGEIKEVEKDMIINTLVFGDLKIKDLMIKKKRVFFLSHNYLLEEAREIISKKPFTRVPFVLDGKVVGILYAKDLLKVADGRISKIVRKPFFVKENVDVSKLFKKMKMKRIHMAIVEDDNSNFKGILTLEDIIEVVMGDIKDEYFKEKSF